MADKQKKRFKWKTLSLFAYLFATAVGYLYATGYYGEFGIDILNYVEPVDFLLISLDNVNEVLTFSGLIVPFVLPSIILILAGVISLSSIVIFATLATVSSLALILYSCSLLVLAAIAAVARRVVDQIKWIGETLRVTFGRQQGTEEEGHSSTFGEKIRRFVTTYKEVAEAHPSKPTKEDDYYTGAKEVALRMPKVWRWIPQILRPIQDRTLRWLRGFFQSESSWRPKGWASMGRLRQLVVMVTLAYIGAAAYVNGKIVAQTLRLDAEGAVSGGQSKTLSLNNTSNARAPTSFEKTWAILRSAVCPIVPSITCEVRPVITYAIPTANLATLELNECKAGVDNLKFARANLRQDASDGAHRAASDCHVYLGATGSMQFLADFHGADDESIEDQSDGRRNPPIVIVVSGDEGLPPSLEPVDARPPAVVFDARNGGVSAHACDWELVSVIGPFQTGTTEMEEAGKECEVPEHGKIETVSTEDDFRDLRNYGTLVLVGRADVRPINNRNFDSNMELAQARVKKVAQAVSQQSLSVLSISAGPVDSPKGADPCSRIVEIYGCPADVPSASAGTVGAGEGTPSNLEGDS